MPIQAFLRSLPWAVAAFAGPSHGLLAQAVDTTAGDEITDLAPMVVYGDLLLTRASDLSASSTLLGQSTLQTATTVHFEDVLDAVPNLSFAGGTARPRFFQIRGIGQNSQFGNEIPATSVGFLMDGIDLTGMASIASLYDAAQVEVLRGPQAAAFGANAMAGLIVVRSHQPTPHFEGFLESSFGEDNLRRFAAAASGPIGQRGSALQFRVSGEQLQRDGWHRNTFLDRNDTNQRDETSTRLQLRWQPVERFSADLTAFYADFDNGYDVWSLDQIPYRTSTDEPGSDRQTTRALSLRATMALTGEIDLLYLGAVSDTDILYAYDWDWSNFPELRERYGPVVYGGTDVTRRQRTIQTHDLRLRSLNRAPEDSLASWAAGLHARDFSEDQSYFGTNSTYEMDSTAAYAQARIRLHSDWLLTAAARLENATIDFARDDGFAQGNEETLYGGKLALNWEPQPHYHIHLSLDRGYKLGGINLDEEVPDFARVYDTETLWNMELGTSLAFPQQGLRARLTAFHMERRDIQTDTSVQAGDGNTFALYKDNAASGTNRGLEAELSWQIHDALRLSGSVGYLDATFDEYRYTDPVDPSLERVFDDADQPYAPAFTFRLGADFALPNGFFAQTSLSGRDHYVFDLESGSLLDSHSLLDAAVGYQDPQGTWEVRLWVRNALDERYERRGFYFANEPPAYDNPRKWTSFGDPRQWGLTVRWNY